MEIEFSDYEKIAQMALQLPPRDKLRLIERLAYRLRYDVGNGGTTTIPLLGALADLGPAPSAEEIDEARRETWGEYVGEAAKE